MSYPSWLHNHRYDSELVIRVFCFFFHVFGSNTWISWPKKPPTAPDCPRHYGSPMKNRRFLVSSGTHAQNEYHFGRVCRHTYGCYTLSINHPWISRENPDGNISRVFATDIAIFSYNYILKFVKEKISFVATVIIITFRYITRMTSNSR